MKLLSLVTAALCFVAMASLPYDFYTFLRWIVFVMAIVSALRMKRTGWFWTLGILAIIFNPIIPFRFSKETWQILDFGAGIIFIIVAANINKSPLRRLLDNAGCLPVRLIANLFFTDQYIKETLYRLYLSNKQVSDLSPLSEMKNLQYLFLENTQVSDLSPLRELKELKCVYLNNTQVRDLSPLSELKNLKRLPLWNTQVSDLSPLSELKNLKDLPLWDTQVSDLSPLRELKNLESLNLTNTQVSDLSPLSELKNLRRISLNDTQVSDLRPLSELKNLEYIHLPKRNFTENQIEEFKKAHPNCDIEYAK